MTIASNEAWNISDWFEPLAASALRPVRSFRSLLVPPYLPQGRPVMASSKICCIWGVPITLPCDRWDASDQSLRPRVPLHGGGYARDLDPDRVGGRPDRSHDHYHPDRLLDPQRHDRAHQASSGTRARTCARCWGSWIGGFREAAPPHRPLSSEDTELLLLLAANYGPGSLCQTTASKVWVASLQLSP